VNILDEDRIEALKSIYDDMVLEHDNKIVDKEGGLFKYLIIPVIADNVSEIGVFDVLAAGDIFEKFINLFFVHGVQLIRDLKEVVFELF
jgi:hypothetical protein